jgi:hypothetical protein
MTVPMNVHVKTYYYYERNDLDAPIETNCLLFNAITGEVARGMAFCCPKDNPCKRTGRGIALSRATEAMKRQGNVALNRYGSPKGLYNPRLNPLELKLIGQEAWI